MLILPFDFIRERYCCGKQAEKMRAAHFGDGRRTSGAMRSAARRSLFAFCASENEFPLKNKSAPRLRKAKGETPPHSTVSDSRGRIFYVALAAVKVSIGFYLCLHK